MSAERIEVAYALISDVAGRVLLVHNRDSWSLPGGRREDGETLAEAAVRETREEAGGTAGTGPVVHVSEHLDQEVHDTFVVFRAEILTGEASADQRDDDVSQARWVSAEQAGTLMPWYPDGVAALLAASGAGYSTVRE